MAQAKKQQKQYRKYRNRIVTSLILFTIIVGLLALHLSRVSIPVLQPAGPIAAGQRDLLVQASLLMLIVVIPVFVLAFGFAWRYRESNHKATYKPDWDRNLLFESIWWFIPSALIFVLGIITWNSTYKYDPYKQVSSRNDPITIQVVALDWRWLFIYPEQKVASINELRFPVNTPLKFEITADAPMNSFWIPQLGGQMYAMQGMGTKLNLLADRTGRFYGSSANISGEGFASMNFEAHSTSREQFDSWVATLKQKPSLSHATYAEIAKPTTNENVLGFSKPADDLYGTIISKYMNEHTSHSNQQEGQ